MNKIKPETKASYCKHRRDEYCLRIKHNVKSGYASMCHCKNCKHFELNDRGDRGDGIRGDSAP